MKLASFLFISIIMMSCSSQKIDYVVEPAKSNRVPYAQAWTGGIPGSGSGVNVYLPNFDIAIDHIEEVYFRGMASTMVEKVEGTNDVMVRFATDFNRKPDINMSLDPEQEYGNMTEEEEDDKIPFELKNDEIIVKFNRNGRTYHTKFIGVKDKMSQDMPSRPQ
ncbi:hypothetical protein [Nonlabens ponticola]|uniref:DUF4251 domain-containing protein n=1 Tax=Nonlabens ponticola TaxID=2496866 RepID=A0A3S9MVH5_9FLAO|nr:hypothetical protein [Nonlabens ponticola]AZQ43226.1 hypothetical protein EJ995_02865 [Nonlabens ponticola]